MMELQQLHSTINSLNQKDLANLYHYIEQHLTTHVRVSGCKGKYKIGGRDSGLGSPRRRFFK